MPGPRPLRRAALLGVLGPLCASVLEAQGGLDVSYGRWWHDSSSSTTVTAAYLNRLLGPIDFGLGIYHLDDSRSAIDRTQSGGELSLGVGRVGGGLYAVGSVGLGMRHDNGNLDALWSAGAGYALNLFGFLQLAAEARYRIEDASVGGFWGLEPEDRKGFSISARLAMGRLGRRSTARGSPQPSGPSYDPPSESDIERAAHGGGVTEESADLSVDVVQTALAAMGEPYRWGGTGEGGYDCSGLIQFAYGEHGILLPRVSRDQVRAGTLVPKDVAALNPGDILGFSIEGGGVSHVGLYVGDGTFIHSASSGGVKLSSLSGTDPESRWWRQRWVVARRILN